jgi:putative MATE family efflux protein
MINRKSINQKISGEIIQMNAMDIRRYRNRYGKVQLINEYDRKILVLMLPLIASNILQQLYNTIDSVVISRFTDESSFAAVGIASSVMNLFTFFLVGACTGVSVLFSQSYGKRDYRELKNCFFQSLIFGLLISVVLSVCGIFGLGAIFTLIRVPSQLTPLVRIYLAVVLLGLPATYVYNLCSALLRSAGHTAVVLLVLLICVVVNTGLDIFMVAALGLGIFGAAFATVVSQVMSAVLCFVAIKLRYPQLMFGKGNCQFDRNTLRKISGFSSVTALHQSALYIGKLMVQGIVNTAGQSAIAGFTAATRIEGFANSFADSGCAATAVFVGQACGAGDREGKERYYHSSAKILSAMGIISGVIMFATAPQASALFSGAGAQALADSVAYLRLISVFYMFCFTGNTFAGYFDGIGKVHIPFIGAASHITLRIMISALLISRMGLSSVALACGIGWIYVNIFWSVLRRYFLKREISQN